MEKPFTSSPHDTLKSVFHKLNNILNSGITDTVASVRSILESIPTEEARDRDLALRVLLSKHSVKCPVDSERWSMINIGDPDMLGFSATNLQAYHDFLKQPEEKDRVEITLLAIRDMALAAKLAYEDPSVIIFTVQKIWNMKADGLVFPFKEITAFIMHDEESNNIVLSFRGTELLSPKNWDADLDMTLIQMKHRDANNALPLQGSSPMVHSGFYRLLGLTMKSKEETPYDVLCQKLLDLLLTDPNRKIWITGHSLGAALASVFVAQMILDDHPLMRRLAGVYTFGQPRCGDGNYVALFKDLILKKRVFRVVNQADTVTNLPFSRLGYAHHGIHVIIQSRKYLILGEQKIQSKINAKLLLPNSTFKQILFFVLPGYVEDHFPSEYVRHLQLFLDQRHLTSPSPPAPPNKVMSHRACMPLCLSPRIEGIPFMQDRRSSEPGRKDGGMIKKDGISKSTDGLERRGSER